MIDSYLFSWLIPLLWTLVVSYAIFTFALTFLWLKIPSANKKAVDTSAIFISVIIPVRNEQDNILHLLSDLNSQSFPCKQFEVLVMDDGSTDDTASLVRQFAKQNHIDITLIDLPDIKTSSPKKRAIETAIAVAKGILITTTDGDCRVGTDWLQSIADCYARTNAKLISGPVTFMDEHSLTDHLQTVEFSSLIGSGASAISAGFPSLCNGANLSYEKNVFNEVKGFDGVRHIASGDDEFLMHKIAAKYPDGVKFLKNPSAVVRTGAHQEWTLFFRQRKRWASKWKHYKSKTPLVLALYVFLCNFSLIMSCVVFFSGSINAYQLGIFWLIKCAPEWFFLGLILRFLGKNKSILFIPLTQIIYPFYVCFFGLAVQKPTYEWKGRKLV